MLRSYLTTAWRSLRRGIGYATLNVTGLAAGLTCVILIGLWVEHELSYDAFHDDADQTYRIVREWRLPSLEAAIAYTPNALAPTLMDEVPEVDLAVRTADRRGVVQAGDRRFYESGMLFVDPGFLDVFDFPLVRGQAELDRPGTVLLTPEMASKYFPDRDPIGKTIQFNRSFEVTGIIAEPPATSTIQFDFLVSQKDAPALDQLSWGYNNFRTYVRLRPDASRASLEGHLADIVKTYISANYREQMGDDMAADAFLLHAQPLTDMHLGRTVPEDVASAGSITYVYLFGGLAFFVLILACINFMNLSTARSVRRANEVGVRKAIGANSGQLVGQFLGESFLTTGISLALAIGTCTALLPAFNDLAGTDLAAASLFTPLHLAAVGALLVVVGVLAGSYPAFVLSRYNATETMRGRATTSRGSARLRQGLVVFQFAISIVLLIGMLSVQKQVDFLTSKSLGFTEENVIVMDRLRSVGDQTPTMKKAMAKHAGVEAVTSGFSLPGTLFINSMWRNDAPDATDHNLNYSYVAPTYFDVIDVEMLAGRAFMPGRSTDSTAAVINHAAAQKFGWTPQEALGKKIQNGPNGTPQTVIGVTKDFHYESLRNEIYPLAIFHQQDARDRRYLAVRVQPGRTAEVVDALRATWSEFSPLPFDHSFLAEDLQAQYTSERRLTTLVSIFTGLAILIAVLGLLGLASYSAQQRRQEIGVRKAMGASVRSIIRLLSKDFLTLVGIAFVVAAPLAYYGVQQWLNDFPYHTDLSVLLFALAGLGAFLAAGIAVGYQAWRAARISPVDALQVE